MNMNMNTNKNAGDYVVNLFLKAHLYALIASLMLSLMDVAHPSHGLSTYSLWVLAIGSLTFFVGGGLLCFYMMFMLRGQDTYYKHRH